MIRYKSEMLKVSFKWVTSSITDEELVKLDEVINKRSKEGWDLVSYSFMGGSGGGWGRGILMTFKRE